jgi:hypothetical protein
MRRDLSIALLAIAVLVGAACSGGGSNGGDAAAGAGGGGGPGGGGGGGGSSSTKTCQDIRLCAADCADDACVANCEQGASADNRANFEALDECTKTTGGCSDRSSTEYGNCFCLAQCVQDPPCLSLVDACFMGNGTDDVCIMCQG